jgi:hypothetical protein
MEPIHHAIEPLTEAKSYHRYDRLTEPDSTAPIEHDFSTCLANFFLPSLRMSALSLSTAGRGLHMPSPSSPHMHDILRTTCFATDGRVKVTWCVSG